MCIRKPEGFRSEEEKGGMAGIRSSMLSCLLHLCNFSGLIFF